MYLYAVSRIPKDKSFEFIRSCAISIVWLKEGTRSTKQVMVNSGSFPMILCSFIMYSHAVSRFQRDKSFALICSCPILIVWLKEGMRGTQQVMVSSGLFPMILGLFIMYYMLFQGSNVTRALCLSIIVQSQ